MRADALAVGCLLAVLAQRGARLRAFTASPWSGVGWAAVTVAVKLSAPYGGRYAAAYAMTLMPVAFAGILLAAVAHARHWLYAWLNTPVMRYLGLVSYSLYLYHSMGDNVAQRLGGGTVVAAAASLAMAMASYHLVEKPFSAVEGALGRDTARPGAPGCTMQKLRMDIWYPRGKRCLEPVIG